MNKAKFLEFSTGIFPKTFFFSTSCFLARKKVFIILKGAENSTVLLSMDQMRWKKWQQNEADKNHERSVLRLLFWIGPIGFLWYLKCNFYDCRETDTAFLEKGLTLYLLSWKFMMMEIGMNAWVGSRPPCTVKTRETSQANVLSEPLS